MKIKIVVFILILGVLALNLPGVILMAGFQINRASIAQTSCINKERPWLNCNGRCVLKKKFIEAQKKEKQQEIKSFTLDFMCDQNAGEKNTTLFSFRLSTCSPLLFSSPFSLDYPIFQPPG